MAEKIRLLHCIETISSGGVEKVRLTIADNLDFEKFDYKIICTQAKGIIKERLEARGVEIFEVGPFVSLFEWKKYRKVIKIINAYKPHLIHGAVFEGMSMATIGGLCGRVPIVILEETSDPQTRSKKAIWLQRMYAVFADKVVGISPAVVKYLQERVKISSKKTILITNGVSIPKRNDQEELSKLKVKLGFKQNDFIIGSVGRVHNKVKRFSDILEAIKDLNNFHVKFLLVGAGPDLNGLVKKAKELSLENQFVSVGFQGDTNPFYSIMDLFCLPSAHEGFGLVAAEAMLHNLPVVATNVGGLKDIVIDGETGFLVSRQSPQQLAKKFLILIGNEELRKSFGEKGYKRAIENYTEKQYCENLFSLYDGLLKQKGISI
ncbi:glycosyltransferase [Lunatibacter salilacus]|uniref:glycosyltransferase n=1 Tax=Lunatibacter salilacus TaxID=2483804 RepID=UPI00131A6F44|nr:glycosyltransferase [Lunatibacter salilacus]